LSRGFLLPTSWQLVTTAWKPMRPERAHFPNYRY